MGKRAWRAQKPLLAMFGGDLPQTSLALLPVPNGSMGRLPSGSAELVQNGLPSVDRVVHLQKLYLSRPELGSPLVPGKLSLEESDVFFEVHPRLS